MLSVNASVEDIHKYALKQQRTSQINPNHSSTNISQINQPRALRGPYGQFVPITPPLLNSPTPVTDKRDFFTLGSASHASSCVSLDTYPIPEDSATGFYAGNSEVPDVTTALWIRKWAPDVNWEVVALCGFWYAFSVVSSNSTKAILSRFLYPITLTQFQFVLNAVFCAVLYMCLSVLPGLARKFPLGLVPPVYEPGQSLMRFLTPTKAAISTTLPMGVFQFVGHITSHKATSVIPVSLVHTVKALSPITTILIYRLMYNVTFKRITYVTLIPLMLGIMITCYKPRSAWGAGGDGYLGGLMYAFVSMFIFVSQNIFAKKRLTYTESESKPEALPVFMKDGEKKLDKLTILLFCSATGFLFTMPVYVISELLNDVYSLAQVDLGLLWLVVLNGFSHFMQSLLAFLLLGTISTVNYSIANIMKRIMVIIFAFVWEASSFTGTQSYGILLTAFGLYAYDKWGIERKKTRPA